MSTKPIRLLNVDQIVTSSGHQVDLSTIKSVSEWVIEGAAKSATYVIQIGGYTGNGQNTSAINRMTIADNAVQTSWSYLTRPTTNPPASSNGSRWIITSGMNAHQGSVMGGAPQWYNQINSGDFDSNSTLVDLGSLNGYYGGAGFGLSDGTNHYEVGGYHGHGGDLGWSASQIYHDHIIQVPYSDTSSNQIDLGTLTNTKSGGGATSDHDNGYLFGGFYYQSQSSPNVNTTEIEKFSCSSGASVVDANLSFAFTGQTTAGNGTKAVVKGYMDSTWGRHNDQSEYQFSSQSVNNSYGTFALNYCSSACSAGDEIAGVYYDGSTHKFFKDSWDSGSTAIAYGSGFPTEAPCVSGG